MLRPGQEWKCPGCGTLNLVYSYSNADCQSCGYIIRSYTDFLRTLFLPYRGQEMEFSVDWGLKKGRRKLKPNQYRGLFQTIRHDPVRGYFMEFVVLSRRNRRNYKLRMSFPLNAILPWGKDLYNVIYNPEVLLAFITGGSGLQKRFLQTC